MVVSVVVPFFNEAATLDVLVERVLAAPLPEGFRAEVLLVDDGSTDGSTTAARAWERRRPGTVRALILPRNQGKGAAVRAGIAAAVGEVVLVQDADLEYEPRDYETLLAPFRDPRVGVVYGSRVLGRGPRSYSRYYWGGRLVSWWTSLLYGQRITDEPTGYKVFHRSIALALDLSAQGFEFCPELTGKLLRAGHTIHEVPIHYAPRSFAEGKKIRPRDGILALWVLLAIRLGLDRRGAR